MKLFNIIFFKAIKLLDDFRCMNKNKMYDTNALINLQRDPK